MAKSQNKSKKTKKAEPKQPYSNMEARKAVLMIGLVMSIIALGLVVVGALNLFAMPNMFKTDKPLDVMIYLLAAGVGVAFVALVFGVAGANTSKPIARLSFFFSINSFIFGTGILIVVLLVFKGLIPLPGLEAVSGGSKALLLM